jgi:predicted membrane-bound spermidine synthase
VEIIFLSIFLILVSTSWIPYMYGYSYSLNRLVPKIGIKGHLTIMITGLIAIAVAMDPSFMLVEKWMKAAGMTAMLTSYALPFCLLAYILAHERITGRKSG